MQVNLGLQLGLFDTQTQTSVGIKVQMHSFSLKIFSQEALQAPWNCLIIQCQISEGYFIPPFDLANVS